MTFKPVLKSLPWLAALFTLADCASQAPNMVGCASTFTAVCQSGDGPSSVATSGTAPVMRYLAWMDGDVQTNYEPDRAVAETKLGQWEGKIPESTDTDNYLEYLSVLDASGRTTDSEKRIKKYLAENPSEKRAVFLLGVHYMRRQKKDLANHFFTQLEKDPAFAWKSLLYNNMGMLALQDKNKPLAIEYFEKATKAQPPTPAPFVNLGAIFLQSRSYIDAEQLFTRAKQLDADFEDAALGLGSALEGQGKFEDAHRVYGEFIAGNPNALSVLYNDSIILGNRLKQREEAAQMLLRYIQRGGKETAKAHEIIQSWR